MSTIVFYTQAYDAQPYIERAMRSVLDQTHADLIYVIAENGSTDGTREIIRRYERLDARIAAFYFDENDAIGCFARMLETIYDRYPVAYLATLDADDWYEPDFARACIELMEAEGADLAIAGSQFQQRDGMGQVRLFDAQRCHALDRRGIARSFPRLHEHFRTHWGKVFRLPMLARHRILPNLDLQYGSDTGLIITYLSHIERICLHRQILHNYRHHAGSTSFRYRPNRIESDFVLHRMSMTYLQSIDGLSERNLAMLYCVSIHAFVDTCKISFQQLHRGPSDVLELLAHPFVREIWSYPCDAPGRESIMESKTTARAILLSLLMQHPVRKEEESAFFALLCLLCPELSGMYAPEDMRAFQAHRRELSIVCQGIDRSTLAALIAGNPDRFARVLHAMLSVRIDGDYGPFTAIWRDASPRQMEYVATRHPLLRHVDGAALLRCDETLVNALLMERYDEALTRDAVVLEAFFERDVAIADACIHLGLLLSDLLEREDARLFFLKATLDVHIQWKRWEAYESAYARLHALIPDDPELHMLHEAYCGHG